MLCVRLKLVRFSSVYPDEDEMVDWLRQLDFWNQEVEARIVRANNHLPLDLEISFRERFQLPFGNPTNRLFEKLLQSETGMLLKRLGFEGCECSEWEDPETCTGKILSLELARVQDKQKLKASKIAFDPRVQYLVGARAVPIA